MSVKTALAKLSALAAGGALVGGGAVHVAEPPAATTTYKSEQVVKGPQPVKYIKEEPRRVPKTVLRERRIVTEEECCQEIAMVPVPLPLPQQPVMAGGGGQPIAAHVTPP